MTTNFTSCAASLNGASRLERFMGRDHRVVHAVLIRSQVLHNNLGASFLPPEELTAEWASVWNGIPVLVGDHPAERGQAVSGRTPAMLQTRGVGWVFDARIENVEGTRRLAADVWLDPDRVAQVPGFAEVLAALDAGGIVELSTGFPLAVVEARTGTHAGEAFDLVLRPGGADHLVISTTIRGACGVAHGCGLGANKEELAMAGEQAVNCDEPPIADADEARYGIFGGIATKIASLWAEKQQWRQAQEAATRRIARELEAMNAEQPSDQEREQMIRDSLQARFGGMGRDVNVAAVFGEEREVVFWLNTPQGADPPGAEFLMSTFEEANGTITFSEPTKVRRAVRYLPVAMNHEEVIMNKTEETGSAAAVGGNAAKPGEIVLHGDGELQSKTTDELKKQVGELQEALAVQKKAVAALEVAAAPAIAEREQERQTLVKALAANERVPFSEAELESRPLEELRKLEDMSRGVSYAARGGPQPLATHAQGDEYAPPVPYWNTKAAEARNGKEGA